MPKSYRLSENKDLIDLIEKYDLTYTQAKRYQMRLDGMTNKEIVEAEGGGVGVTAIQASYDLAKRKMVETGEIVFR